MKNTELHDLTALEIAKQVKLHGERRQQIKAERASLYAHALKNGSSTESPVIDSDERASREIARNLLNGAAPPSLSLPPEITRDRMLLREERAIDIVLSILQRKDLEVRAVAAVEWAVANTDAWRQLAREISLTAIRLNSLESKAREFFAACPDITSVRLGMPLLSNARSVSEIPIDDLKSAALSEGLINAAEIRKAQTC
jgi:hypothetical protein